MTVIYGFVTVMLSILYTLECRFYYLETVKNINEITISCVGGLLPSLGKVEGEWVFIN
ncbi:MAG TPA: hypothetical protein VJY64_00225 [Candidatus Onthovivens sp.]|nr:hypothetical protein [Candidatus Onthovivens sp.]